MHVAMASARLQRCRRRDGIPPSRARVERLAGLGRIGQADTLRQRPNAKAVTETGSQGVDHAVSPFPRTCPALAPRWPRPPPPARAARP